MHPRDDLLFGPKRSWRYVQLGDIVFNRWLVQISSTNDAFLASFSSADLKLVNAGSDGEQYRLQITQTKTVSVMSGLGSGMAQCDFNSTTFQAYLYTKMARTYPNPSQEQQMAKATFPLWPFGVQCPPDLRHCYADRTQAVRIEQVIGGGQGVPNCYQTSQGTLGEPITAGLNAQDAGSLCSCLYKDYQTPSK